MKLCSECGYKRPLDDFYNNPNNKTDGKKFLCKTHHNLQTRRKRDEHIANGMCRSHPKRPIAEGSNDRCVEFGHSRRISAEEVKKLPATVKSYCNGVTCDAHPWPIHQLTSVKRNKTGTYAGICRWCHIMLNSSQAAKKRGYKPLNIQGQKPDEFFPKALADQNSTCFFPDCTVKENGKSLAADHDHRTGRFRGFACMSHNSRYLHIFDWIEDNGGTIINLPIAYPGYQYYDEQFELKQLLANPLTKAVPKFLSEEPSGQMVLS